jgi:hypothetical protein
MQNKILKNWPLSYLNLRISKSHFFNDIQNKKTRNQVEANKEKKLQLNIITLIKPSSEGAGDSSIKWIDLLKNSRCNVAPFLAKQRGRDREKK